MARAASAVRLPFHVDLGSWLNAVEGFFAILAKRRLKRGVFKSVVDLQACINRFLAQHNQNPKPFTWSEEPKEDAHDHGQRRAAKC